ncbi:MULTISPECIES: cytochrome c [unclassified Novosphingobium]|nr:MULTISPECIES: cytochrome c [unclassified Novosphingobium]MBB3374014.1 mono/diheme cytochrome c family protein [Novosphingobium sp. BK280]MBB3378426.1 mono/diheme cytochrome c family protein [Novosphingobium sp. BK258]MBB3500272.1 mono/diheme cytochrome c family protein [Novosphingobium sp. BK336]MBB3651504.1 mono/diheme cytochrome c family protein [Novosphingobium sp. BK626]
MMTRSMLIMLAAALPLPATPALAQQGGAPAVALPVRQALGKVLPQRSPEQVYAKVCGYCHGRNVGPIILGRGLPAEAVRYIVRHGQNAMPAFRPTEITPAELDALSQWVSQSPARKEEHGQ